MKKIIITILFLFSFNIPLLAETDKEIVNQQDELERIKNEMLKSRQKLDSLKNVEGDLNKQLNNSESKIRSDNKVVNRLNNQLKDIQNTIKETEDILESQRLNLNLAQKRYLGNIRDFYISSSRTTEVFSEDPNESLRLNRQKVYLTSVAEFESEKIDLAYDYLIDTEKRIDDLGQEKKNFNHLKQKKETAISLEKIKQNKQKSDLKKIQNKKTIYSDRLMTLEQMANEMESIIQNLQDQLAMEKIAESQISSFFSDLKGQLLKPYSGKLIQEFGNFVNPITKIKYSSSGISIKGTPGGSVKAVASGSIAYVGNLRGYGNFIIINHDNRFYTTYAGLDKMFVTKSEYILSGAKIATTDKEGVLIFEIRDRNKAIDPIEWLSNDSF